MKAGQLRHRLIFQVKTSTTENSVGTPIITWPTAFEVWGAFEPLGSREFPAVQKRHEQTTARFRIRYRNDVDPALHRISYAGKAWNIHGPIDLGGRGVELHIEATETQ